MNKQKLKPCPFCGYVHPVEGEDNAPEATTWVYCPRCYAEGPKLLTMRKAIAAWNRRKP